MDVTILQQVSRDGGKGTGHSHWELMRDGEKLKQNKRHVEECLRYASADLQSVVGASLLVEMVCDAEGLEAQEAQGTSAARGVGFSVPQFSAATQNASLDFQPHPILYYPPHDVLINNLTVAIPSPSLLITAMSQWHLPSPPQLPMRP